MDSKYIRWAEQQILDYENRSPGSLFANGLSLTVEEGYRLQNAVTKLRIERGDRIVGHKVGCTSPKIRDQLGIKHRVTGRLYKSEWHHTGASLKLENYSKLAIEGELAVILRRTPTPSDFTQSGIPPCVSKIMPVIELHNHVMYSTPPSAGELIANNAIHAGFVAGTPADPPEDFSNARLSILIDGNAIESCGGFQLIDTIRSSLQWLHNSLETSGERLQKDEVILTGSVPSLIPITQGCMVQINASPFGETRATFVQ